MPPYTTNSAGFSATSASRLFINMRSGASVIQVRALNALPRAARMIRGVGGASILFPLGAKAPRQFVASSGIVQARHRTDLAGSPSSSDHNQAGLVTLHRQQLARPIIWHFRAQMMFRFLQ